MLDHPTPDLMPQSIRWQLGADLAGADLTGVAATAAGMSGASIAAVVRAARGRARSERRALALGDLAAEIAARQPPLPASLRWRVAVHEAGHAVAGAATGLAVPRMLLIQPDGGTTWQVLVRGGSQRADIEAGLVVNLAGRTAELLLLGQPSGGAGGPAGSDLASATAAAAALEASWGLGQSLLWLGTPEDAALRLRHDPALQARVESHLRRAETRALAVLTANRGLLTEMAQALDAAGVLVGATLDDLAARVVTEGAAISGPYPEGEPGAGPPQAGLETEAEAVPQLSDAKADDQQVPMARMD
jgi:ATP-dependent Zn protease